jgi:hypothetical protein
MQFSGFTNTHMLQGFEEASIDYSGKDVKDRTITQ